MTHAELQAARERGTWRKEAPKVGGWYHWRDGDEGEPDGIYYLVDLDNGSQPGPLYVDADATGMVPLPEWILECPDGEWLPCDPTLAPALIGHIDEQAREIARLTAERDRYGLACVKAGIEAEAAREDAYARGERIAPLVPAAIAAKVTV